MLDKQTSRRSPHDSCWVGVHAPWLILEGAMPRPPRPRRVIEGLEGRVYKPRGVAMSQLEEAVLTLDGLEALRLADMQGLYQEAAAERMGVSRATFARVLSEARRIVADALVEGKALNIGGGAISRCPRHEPHGPGQGRRRRCRGS